MSTDERKLFRKDEKAGEKNMNRKETALELKHNGCNCCQAVILAFADRLGTDTNEGMALGSAFGMGMGCTKATCGALIGAGVVLGKLESGSKPVGQRARTLLNEFESRCGAVRCADLKGVGTGKVLCSCDDCVANAVEILEKMLET